MLYFDLFGWRLVTVKKGMAPLHVFLTFFQVLFVNLQRPPIQPGGCKDVQKLDKSIMVFAFFSYWMKHVISALVCGAHTTDKKQTHNNIWGGSTASLIALVCVCVCTVELDFAIYVCRYIESLGSRRGRI